MGSLKKTSQGLEISYRLLGIVTVLVALGSGFVGVTAATVRAADQLEATASKSELRDSLKVIHEARAADSARDAIHEAKQDSVASWYGRQVWALLCSKYHNPEAFCTEPAFIMQAGRPR